MAEGKVDPVAQQPAQAETTEVSGLAQLVSGLAGLRVQTAKTTEKERLQYWDTVILEYLKWVAKDTASYPEDVANVLEAHIAAIDQRLGQQLDEIVHHSDFQRLEASWRGLYKLVANADTSDQLQIKVLPVSRDELAKDLGRSRKVNQSELYKRVYNRGLGTLRGQPFGALVGDYEFGGSKDDVDLLDKLGQLGAKSLAPFLTAASPDLLDVKDFGELKDQTLRDRFGKDYMAAWRGLRQKDHAKFLGITAPRTLVRLPHETTGPQGLEYKESIAGKDNSRYLWGNAAYPLAGRVLDSFAQHGWCLAMRGVQGGGLVEDLPVHHYKVPTDRPGHHEQKTQWPVDVAFNHEQETDLGSLGIAALVHLQKENQAAFLAVPSVFQPSEYVSTADTANELLASQLPYTFSLCRFAHHIKHMVYDRIGKGMAREQLESFLHNWLYGTNPESGYVSPANSSHETKAKKPLRKATVEVVDKPGKPGSYEVRIKLVPHFLLDSVDVRLSLDADVEEVTQNR